MPNPTKPKIAFAHLGCDKNRVDTEHMIGLLAAAGYGVGTDESEADYVIVNTCSFIQAAREESVRTLVELAEANKKNCDHGLFSAALSRGTVGGDSRSGGRCRQWRLPAHC